MASKLVSLKGIHDASVDFSKPAKPAPAATSHPPAVVKVKRLDGREDEIDPTIGATFVMPRLSHPEKLVSNKAEALRRFAERKARDEGRRDPELERRAAEAEAEAAAKRAAKEAAATAERAARPKWRSVGPGRVVTLSGAEPTARSTAAAGAVAAPAATIKLPTGSPSSGGVRERLNDAVGARRAAGGGSGGNVGVKRPRPSDGGVLSRIGQPAGGGVGVVDARKLISVKRR